MQSDLMRISQETRAMTKQIFSQGPTVLRKSGITVSGLGLVGYDLERPSKRLFPVLSPLRNRFARVMGPEGSLAANWRAITGINTANQKAFVAEGTRNANPITYTTVNKSATYKTFGEEDSISFQSIWQARGFEDIRATSALSTLQATMIEEEKILLGAVSSTNTFGAPATPTAATVTNSAAVFAANDKVGCKVVALSLYGWLNSWPNATGATAASNLADHSSLSGAVSIALPGTTGTGVQFAVTPVDGAFAYAWFLGEGSSITSWYLDRVTTVPSILVTATTATANLNSTNIAADTSGDANAFDGVFLQSINVNATYTTLETDTSGVLKIANAGTTPTSAILYDMNAGLGTLGTVLTNDGAGGIAEFDAVLKALWDQARIGPSLCLMNSQEARSASKLLGLASTTGGVRFPVTQGTKTNVGGQFYEGYVNKFTSSLTPGVPDVIPFMIHPYLPPGTIIFLSETLPYPNSQVNNVYEVETLAEYADYEFAMTQMSYPHGVYAMEALKCYFPAGVGVIRSIAPT